MNLALFDFDHTLTKEDSLLSFIKHAKGKTRFYLGMVILSPFFVQHILKIVPAKKTKERILAHFFKGVSQRDFKATAREYSLNQIKAIENREITEKMMKHKENGDRVIVVTASLECWVTPWCIENGVEYICSKAEFIDGIFSGKLEGENCKGKEKLKRIHEKIDIKNYPLIYAYGNMPDDQEMFSMADKKTVI